MIIETITHSEKYIKEDYEGSNKGVQIPFPELEKIKTFILHSYLISF